MSEFTKGPWRIDKDYCTIDCAGSNNDESTVAAFSWVGGYPMKNWEANAALIVTSPELYKACEELLEMAEGLEIEKFGKVYSIFKFTQIRNLLKRARGEDE